MANTGWCSPYEAFFSRLPALQVVPLFLEGMMRVDRSTKSDVQSVLCYFFNNGHNHPSSTVKGLLIKASTDGISYTSDVVWTVPRAPVLPSPAPAIAGDQCTPPRRQRRCSTSATCRYHHRFGHQSYSHCRRRSSPRRHRYRRLRAHRCQGETKRPGAPS